MLVDRYAGENNGVEEKREHATMHGYLDAKSRHSEDLLNVAINNMIRLMLSLPIL